MFEKPSLTYRIAIGKMIGLLIGIVAFFATPLFLPEASLTFLLGIAFWYVTVGAIIGVFGVYDEHPVLHIPLPWWLRSSMIGAWMNLQMILLAYDHFESLMVQALEPYGFTVSPFWGVAEGAAVGLFIGFIATRFAGEGPRTVTHDLRA